jgi:hypothetical protein
MATFRVPESVGDAIEITAVDGGQVKAHVWHVKDGLVDVADQDAGFFIEHMTGAEALPVGDQGTEDTPPAKESGKTK